MGYGGGESIGGDGGGSGDVYKDKTEPALVSVSDSYSEDEEISVLLWDAWDMNNFYFLFFYFLTL